MAIHQLNSGNLRERLYELSKNPRITHGLFWIILLLLLTLNEASLDSFWFVLSNEAITLGIYALVIYLNLYYLIPNYLTQKRFFTYSALLVTASAIATPLLVLLLYFKFFNHPSLRSALLANQNWYFLTTFVVVSISTIFKIITDWSQQLREKQVLENQTMQSELRFLKSQINPHFLFNTLNNLYALTLKKSDQAPEIVIKLSEMMRYMLYECNEKRVSLEKEVNYIQNYLDLEALRQGKQVEIQFTVEGKIEGKQIAPLMFIPFLENSFKHGLNNHLNQGFVHIYLKVEQEKVFFHIENSKPTSPGTPGLTSGRSGGIGLVNIQRRLQLLYLDHYQLTIEDTPGVYSVRLQLDLN